MKNSEDAHEFSHREGLVFWGFVASMLVMGVLLSYIATAIAALTHLPVALVTLAIPTSLFLLYRGVQPTYRERVTSWMSEKFNEHFRAFPSA